MNQQPFDTPFTQQFFSGYLVDHFLYKQRVLFNALRDAERRVPRTITRVREKLTAWFRKSLVLVTPPAVRGLKDVDYGAYARTLRLEIRATYFQEIETLFELIFGLEPRGNVIDNRRIWYFLATSKWQKNYDRIGEIASGDTAFLDREITAGKNLKVPFIQYLFYFGVTNPSMLEAVKASFDPIKKFLLAFAKEFSNRDEYNAFKHSLRIMPMLQNVQIGPHGFTKPSVVLDLSNSMTYLIERNGSISFKTNSLDTVRDMRMGQVCAYLISNIVRSRRAQLTKNPEGYLHTFTDITYSSASERNVPVLDFNFALTPVPDLTRKSNE